MSPGADEHPAEIGDLVRDECAGVDAVVTDMRRGQPVLRLLRSLSEPWEPQDPQKVTVLKRRGTWTQ